MAVVMISNVVFVCKLVLKDVNQDTGRMSFSCIEKF